MTASDLSKERRSKVFPFSQPTRSHLMKKTLLFATLAIFAQTAFAVNVAKADKDKNGTLDKNEAKAIPLVAKHFEAIDLDKDGTVDQAEIDAFEIMAADKDNDGTLDKKEIKHKGIAKAFDELDADKDGTLDVKEVFAFFQKQK